MVFNLNFIKRKGIFFRVKKYPTDPITFDPSTSGTSKCLMFHPPLPPTCPESNNQELSMAWCLYLHLSGEGNGRRLGGMTNKHNIKRYYLEYIARYYIYVHIILYVYHYVHIYNEIYIYIIYRYAQEVVGFNETRGISWLFTEIMNRNLQRRHIDSLVFCRWMRGEKRFWRKVLRDWTTVLKEVKPDSFNWWNEASHCWWCRNPAITTSDI